MTRYVTTTHGKRRRASCLNKTYQRFTAALALRLVELCSHFMPDCGQHICSPSCQRPTVHFYHQPLSTEIMGGSSAGSFGKEFQPALARPTASSPATPWVVAIAQTPTKRIEAFYLTGFSNQRTCKPCSELPEKFSMS
jgi:hypothetical protein